MNALKEQTVHLPKRAQSNQDFRSLEVREREASIEMIRAAAIRQVRRSRKLADSMMFDDRNAHVAAILASAYRLLDPRRRSTRTERVNLSPLLVRDDDDFHPNVAQPLIVFDATSDLDNDSSDPHSGDSSTDPSLSELRSMLAMLKSNPPRNCA